MGQRQDSPDYDFGPDCNRVEQLVYPLWGDGETPKYVYMRFSLLEKCTKIACDPHPHPPNDRVFRLTQEPGDSCWWAYHGDWEVAWQFRPGLPKTVEFRLNLPFPALWYFDHMFNPDVFDSRFAFNHLNCLTPSVCAHGGFACVRWGPEAETILSGLNMTYESDLFMELWPLVDGKIVYKFCRLEDATNIKILFDPYI